MGDTAKLFMHGRSQAVRLPRAFRKTGKEVRIRREGYAVILEPVEPTLEAWFAQLDELEREHPLKDTPPEQPAPQVRRYWYE